MKTDKRIDNCAPGNRKMKTPALKLGTWNVRTMTPGFSDNLQEVNDARKTAVIDRELSRLQMGIVALQETRLPETGSVRERKISHCSGRANHQTGSENTVWDSQSETNYWGP